MESVVVFLFVKGILIFLENIDIIRVYSEGKDR